MTYDPQITAALIQGASGIIATLIAALAAGLIGKKFANEAKLKELLKTAASDIEFLLAVEAEHCNIHRERTGNSMKLKVRDAVRDKDSSDYSGKFTKQVRMSLRDS